MHTYTAKNINSQAQVTNLLCFLIVFLDRKGLLFNFFEGGLQLLLFLCKLFFFILGFFSPLCQLLNHFLICFYLNLSTVDLSAVFINILRNGMDKKETKRSLRMLIPLNFSFKMSEHYTYRLNFVYCRLLVFQSFSTSIFYFFLKLHSLH